MKTIAGSLEDLIPGVIERKTTDGGGQEELQHDRMLDLLRNTLEDPNIRPEAAAKVVDTLFKLNPPSDAAIKEVARLSNEELIEQIYDVLVPVLRYFDVIPEDERKAEPKEKRRPGRPAKLSMEKARTIRTKYKSGKYKQVDLAREFKVSANLISQVLNNKIYSDPRYAKNKRRVPTEV